MKFNNENAQQLVNLMVDHQKKIPTTVFATAEGRKEAINAKFFDVLGSEHPTEMDLDAHKHEVFAIIQEVARQTIALGDGSELSVFNRAFVEEKNVALGDQLEMEVENDAYLSVGKISGNNWNLKRERVDAGYTFRVKTDAYYVGVYEYCKRVLTGRADFASIMDKVGQTISKFKDDFIATKFTEAISGLPATYKYSGAYVQAEILKRIARVKSANKGAKVTLMGTAEALAKLQNLTATTASDTMLDEMNNSGYLGKFYGNDCVALPTCYKSDSETFAFNDNAIYIVPSNQKLVTIVTEGEPIVKETIAQTENMDMSQDYFVIWRMGGIVLFNSIMGMIEITA